MLETDVRILALATALLALAPATAAAQGIVLEGRGWGHGVGLSQWGAYGFALREGRDHRSILAHYFTGTRLGEAGGGRMRVLLKRSRAPKLCSATRIRDAGARRLRLSERRSYRLRAAGADRLRLIDATNGRTRARLRAPVTVSGRSMTCLRGAAENGVRDGFYRGRMVYVRDGAAVLAVNHVGLEHYLYGVVASEMPSTWPAEALRAQAIVARSYALRSRRPASDFDVFADVRSQVYRGVAGEAASTTAAVRATRGRAVLAGGEVAQTFFFSTSGGRTAGNEEAFGGAPLAYLRPVDDPHDDLSPYHTWTARFSERDVGRRLRGLTPGEFEGIAVATRGASGRAETVDIVGSEGTNTVPAATIRLRLELRSTWFDVG
jgi:stage II sporulation protein D